MRLWILLILAVPVITYGATQVHGDYEVNITQDLMTDQAVASAVTLAKATSGPYGDRHLLALRCKGEAAQILVNWQDYLGDDARSVSYRVDQGEIKRVQAEMDTEGVATFLKPSVIQDLLPGNRVVVEVRDYRGTRHQAAFSLRGITAAWGAIEAHCAVSLDTAVARELDRRKAIDDELAFLAEQQRVAFSGSERERLEFKIRAAKRSVLQTVPQDERARIGELLDAGRLEDARALLPDSPITTSNLAILKGALRDIEAFQE